MSDPRLPTKFEYLYRQVLDAIGRGQFRTGDRIGIKDLAEQLNVSPTPLREVFSRLVGRGVVEERRSEGYYTARLDTRDIADFYALHRCCLGRAIAALRAAMPVGVDLAEPWAIFEFLVRATGNNALIEARALIDDRLMIVRRLEPVVFQGFEGLADGLRSAVTGGDVVKLAGLVRAFHRNGCERAADLALMLGRPRVALNIFQI